MDRTFGDLLRRLRKQAGKTMKDLGDHLKVSTAYISDVERGLRAPWMAERIVDVAEFLNVDPEPLIIAAAQSRGAFQLRANDMPPRAIALGAALQRGWTSLTDDQLDRVRKILEEN